MDQYVWFQNDMSTGPKMLLGCQEKLDRGC